MALGTSDIYNNPDLFSVIKLQSAALIGMSEQDPRLTAVFATQQRWLMSHVALALYFRSLESGAPGAQITAVLDAVVEARIASRNTADSYLKELIHYKYVIVNATRDDRRLRPLLPTDHVLITVTGWLRLHLNSLDSLTGGSRLARFDAEPGALARMQPIISDALVTARAVRNPDRTFSLFTWLDNGGWVMDWLMSNMEDAPLTTPRVAVGMISTTELAEQLKLSRTHLARKLREAELMESLGWFGRRGHSVMWVSRGFREEYASAQAAKLSIIDHAFEAVFGAEPTAAPAASAMQPETVDLAM